VETVTYSQVQDLVSHLPEEVLPAAYRMLLELADRGSSLESQVAFLRLPLPERR